MAESIRTTVSIPRFLFDQVKALAQQMGLSRSVLIGLALEHYVDHHHGGPVGCTGLQPQEGQRDIHQGDIYWLQLDLPGTSEAGYPHPYVVLQGDILNRSRIQTVVVCALTSNIRRAKSPGNVPLEVGEAGLSKPSVVEVSKLSTVDKGQLGAHIGTLSAERVAQIFAGIQFLQAVGRG